MLTFASDTEPYPGGPDPAILKFAKDANVLCLDGQYYEDQYLGEKDAGGVPRMIRGHGYDSWCAEVAKKAQVKQLLIGHHDPTATDERIIKNVRNSREIFKKTDAPHDGLQIKI